MTPPTAPAPKGTATKAKRRSLVVFKATFNGRDDLRISYDELLVWAHDLLEAKEKVREAIKHDAMREFEHDLDGHLRSATIEVKTAEIIKP